MSGNPPPKIQPVAFAAVAINVLLALLPVGLVRGASWFTPFGLWFLALATASLLAKRRSEEISVVFTLPWLMLAGLSPPLASHVWPRLLEWVIEYVLVRRISAGAPAGAKNSPSSQARPAAIWRPRRRPTGFQHLAADHSDADPLERLAETCRLSKS